MKSLAAVPTPIRRSCYVIYLAAGLLLFSPGAAFAQYAQFNLVANRSGMGAAQVDPHLIDPWGVVNLPGGTFAVANAHSGVITFYTSSGSKLPWEVVVPAAPGSVASASGSPTGLVLNLSPDFVIHKDGRSAPALLLVATLDGMICGWNPLVDASHAVIAVDNSTELPFPASYTALSLVRDTHGVNILFAGDSGSGPGTSNNRVDRFGPSFGSAGHFTDLNVPMGMTVFGVQGIGSAIYVTYAGFGVGEGGVVDIFDTEGKLRTPAHFAANGPGGPLEEPWPVVLAPGDFGRFSGVILIGNFSDGRISAYHPQTGTFFGQVANRNGTPIATSGLWALVFADRDGTGQKNRLFFAAGPNSETDGLFGYIAAQSQE
jgi:uncharacterized protein (TIGR03118 family)